MEDIMNSIQGWLLDEGPKVGMKIVGAILIFVIGRIVIAGMMKALKAFIDRSKKMPELLQTFIVGTAQKILTLILLIMIVDQFTDVAPLIAGLGIAGFVLGFALQDSLGNLAAGFMLLFNQPFKVGDFVDIAGTSGVVKALNLSATTLYTPDNKVITTPNSKVWGNTITNFTALDTRRVQWDVGISYGSDIGKAQEIIRGVLNGDQRILKDPAIQVELLAMADSSLNLVVRGWVKTPEFWNVFFDVNKAIKEALDAGGIEIPFPQMDVHFDGPVPA